MKSLKELKEEKKQNLLGYGNQKFDIQTICGILDDLNYLQEQELKAEREKLLNVARELGIQPETRNGLREYNRTIGRIEQINELLNTNELVDISSEKGEKEWTILKE